MRISSTGFSLSSSLSSTGSTPASIRCGGCLTRPRCPPSTSTGLRPGSASRSTRAGAWPRSDRCSKTAVTEVPASRHNRRDYPGHRGLRRRHKRCCDRRALPVAELAPLPAAGPLGGTTRLWSRQFYQRLQVGTFSQVGAFVLTNQPQPVAEPYDWGANEFSVFFPADPYNPTALTAADHHGRRARQARPYQGKLRPRLAEVPHRRTSNARRRHKRRRLYPACARQTVHARL